MAEAWACPLSTETAVALRWAIDTLPDDSSTRTITDRAERFYEFLVGKLPVRLDLVFGPTVDQTTHAPTGQIPQGATMAQLHDSDEFDITVTAKDAKGFEVSDAFTATADNADAVTVVTGADGKTFTVVAGNPGSAVVTVTDGNVSATLAVDVLPGGVALIDLVAGDPRPQV